MTELERKAREMFVLDPAATVRWLLAQLVEALRAEQLYWGMYETAAKQRGALTAQLATSKAHSENLDKSLTRTEGKLKAATETLERANGRAQMADFDMGYVETSKALRDIRAWCTEALTPRADGGGTDE